MLLILSDAALDLMKHKQVFQAIFETKSCALLCRSNCEAQGTWTSATREASLRSLWQSGICII